MIRSVRLLLAVSICVGVLCNDPLVYADEPQDDVRLELLAMFQQNDTENLGEPSVMLNDEQRLARRVAELKKSATELNIAPPAWASSAGLDADAVPTNLAAAVLAQPPVWIVGGITSPPVAERVHVPFCHQPTYFQELNLERCGRLDCGRFGCLQNLFSSVYFLSNTAMLPYRAVSQPHCELVSGYGDCPTCQRYDCPIEPLRFCDDWGDTSRGLAAQAAALAGFAFLVL